MKKYIIFLILCFICIYPPKQSRESPQKEKQTNLPKEAIISGLIHNQQLLIMQIEIKKDILKNLISK